MKKQFWFFFFMTFSSKLDISNFSVSFFSDGSENYIAYNNSQSRPKTKYWLSVFYFNKP